MGTIRFLMPVVFALLTTTQAMSKEVPFDTLILNAHVIDGSGSPWYRADIGIRAGHIAAIGALKNAPTRRQIDARGRVVAPGFIDMLGQSEYTILVDPRLPSKIYQGITTEITGEGNSPAPAIGTAAADLRHELARFGLTPDWTDFDGYFARLERQGIGINLASYVGATAVRKAVIGNDDRRATAAELDGPVDRSRSRHRTSLRLTSRHLTSPRPMIHRTSRPCGRP